MLILHDPATLKHATIEILGSKVIPAHESPDRISAILSAIHQKPTHHVRTINFDPFSDSGITLLNTLSSTHDPGYVEHLQHVHAKWVAEGLIKPDDSVLPECFPFPNLSGKKSWWEHPPKDSFARAGFYAFDMSTGIAAETWEAVVASANLAAEGVREAIAIASPNREDHSVTNETSPSATPTSHPTVLALCRPPGHHCDTRRAGGYCYINNAVVAVETFRRLQQVTKPHHDTAPRIAILDLDFHHGNGTQEAFYSDPHVLYISIHGQDEYPYYTGSAEETGPEGTPSAGMNLNLPLPSRSSLDTYISALEIALQRLEVFAPDLLLVSLGFDTFHLDPLGGFGFESGEDYGRVASLVRGCLGRVHEKKGRSVPSVILLEGGYVLERLGENVLGFLDGWEGRKQLAQQKGQ